MNTGVASQSVGGTAIVANHYQNENCHPDGKIKVGIGADSEWRWERLENARRLFAGARDVRIRNVGTALRMTRHTNTGYSALLKEPGFNQVHRAREWAGGLIGATSDDQNVIHARFTG